MKEINRKIYIEDRHIDKIQLICLLILAVLELLIVTLGDCFLLNAGRFLPLGFMASCGFFLLCELLRMYQSRRIRFPVLPCLMVIWYLINSIFRSITQMETYSSTCFIAVYLLAFPFASVTRDSERQAGLKLTAIIFIVAGLILSFDSVLLLANRVPEFIRSELFWDGTRLNVIMHANISARVFMIGISFCLGFLTLTRKKWLKALLAAVSLAMFMAMALTNSRTAIAITGLMFAGTVFFFIYKDNWKQFLAGAAAALVVMGLLLLGANALYDWNSQRLGGSSQIQQEQSFDADVNLSQSSEENASVQANPLVFIKYDKTPSTSHLSADSKGDAAQQIHPAGSPQGSFFDDLLTLNSRSMIWGNIMKGFQNEPLALLWGARSSQSFVGQGIAHAHNALLEILVKLGLPGFIISLLFTAQALWSAAYLLLSRKADLWKKIIAMLVLCLLASAMMEPFLFMTSTYHNFSDFIFLLCLGYLILWRKALQKEKKQTN